MDEVAGRSVRVTTDKTDHTETPQNGDVLTINSVPYTVTEVLAPGSGSYSFAVIAPESRS